MEMTPYQAAIIAIVGGVLSAGGLASKLVDWASRRTRAKTTIDAHAINADLTVNERLFARIREVEGHLDAERKAGAERVAKLEALVRESDQRHDELLVKNGRLEQDAIRAAAERDAFKRSGDELFRNNAALARQVETANADLEELRKYVKRLERRGGDA